VHVFREIMLIVDVVEVKGDVTNRRRFPSRPIGRPFMQGNSARLIGRSILGNADLEYDLKVRHAQSLMPRFGLECVVGASAKTTRYAAIALHCFPCSNASIRTLNMNGCHKRYQHETSI